MADARFFHKADRLTLNQIAVIIGCSLPAEADENLYIHDVAPLDTAQKGSITFFDNRKYRAAFLATKATACIVSKDFRGATPDDVILLKSEDAYKAYALVAQAFYPEPMANGHIHPKAIIHDTAQLGAGCQIDAGAVIGAFATLGEMCHVGANAVIGAHVQLGNHTIVGANASIECALIGNNVMIYAGARIGQRGFGFAFDPEKPIKVPQLGRVIIGDNVEIGANTCVDRGAGPDTIIESGVMIDNLVQIAHNVHIGRGAIIVSQVGISGSTHIGAYAQVGGQAGLTGHLKIGKGAKIAANSGVMRDVADFETVSGSPAVPIKDHFRQITLLQKLSKRDKSKEL
jgi:UDP-3-O-[3-hydroxymyristoyl] glucosamine N-acyltransferase